MESNGETKTQQQQPVPPPPPPAQPTTSTTTDLFQMCRLCLSTLSAEEGESVFNNQVPSLPEKIYRVFGVSRPGSCLGLWRARTTDGHEWFRRSSFIAIIIVICLWRRFFFLLTEGKILLTDNTGK